MIKETKNNLQNVSDHSNTPMKKQNTNFMLIHEALLLSVYLQTIKLIFIRAKHRISTQIFNIFVDFGVKSFLKVS